MCFESYPVTACLGNCVLTTLLAKPPTSFLGGLREEVADIQPAQSSGAAGHKKAPDLLAPTETFTRNRRHLQHLRELRRGGRAFLGCSHEHRRQQSAWVALQCLSAILDLSQRPCTGVLSVGSHCSAGAGDAKCLACCIKDDLLRMGGFFLGMSCGNQIRHPNARSGCAQVSV